MCRESARRAIAIEEQRRDSEIMMDTSRSIIRGSHAGTLRGCGIIFFLLSSQKKKDRTTLAVLPDAWVSYHMPSSMPPADIPPSDTLADNQPVHADEGKKKKKKSPSSAKKPNRLDPAIRKQRREVIETRILKLEGKLTKDRTLLLRYVEDKDEAEEGAAVGVV